MSLTSAFFKLFYWPVCRAYARHLGDRPADTLLKFLCSLQFRRVHRFWPNFSSPVRFSEKVWSRFLHNRDPIFTLISDKLAVRDYVNQRIGAQYLVPLVWKGNNFDNIMFDELPLKFVIKTNHGCGYNILVKDKNTLDIKQVKIQLNKWLNENFCSDKYLGTEWGYRNIDPTIMIESFIEENGKAPVDYKFYCFSGRVEMVTLHFDRFEEHKTRTFDRNFNPHEFRYDFPQWIGECTRPKNFDTLVHLAESLAAEFDFIRVDLYSSENKIYFSELTPYPGGVGTKFLPIKQDFLLGEKWK
jgi:hypothetical protein